VPEPKPTDRFSRNDVLAGLAAAAVILPQAMAFGVALGHSAGAEAASGAFAGLVGATALCLASGLSGGTRGLVSAPTGPTLVLLSGSAAQLAATGLSGAQLLASLAIVVALAGVVQIGIAVTGGGRLIKFIPYTVVAGFMTGSAILMLLSQLRPLSPAEAEASWGVWRALPLVTAGVTLAAMQWVPRLLPAVPGTIAGLVTGGVFFQVAVALSPHGVDQRWIVGHLPTLEALTLQPRGIDLTTLPWAIIIHAAAALAVLASLDTLLTSVIADVGTGARHDARKELLGQGAGHILSGIVGGIAGAGTTAATIVAVGTGGRRWVAVAAASAFLLLLAVGGPVGTLLPISVLAGIVLHAALGMLEPDVVVWMRRRRNRPDAAIALLVTVVTVGYDLMTAVGVGVSISILLFLREQIRSAVVHRRSTALERRSTRHRSDEQRALLERHGERIVLYELRGYLFFAKAEQLFSELTVDLERPAWVILHMRRVQEVDLTAIRLLRQMADRLDDWGGELIFCEVHKGMGLGRKVKKALRKVSSTRQRVAVRTFNGSDEALEYAENALLTELGSAAPDRQGRVGLKDTDLCRGMDAAQLEILSGAMAARSVDRGKTIFRVGKAGDTLYVVIAGEVDIRLPTTAHHYKRLAKVGPGTIFGEVAFLETSTRTADAVAVTKTELLALSRASFEALTARDASVAHALLAALTRIQAERLRWSARELRRLAEW